MLGFEQYILDNGFWLFKTVNGEKKPCKYYEVSTMGELYRQYTNGSIDVIFGLGEHKRPPTLLQPRSLVGVKGQEGNRVFYMQSENVDMDHVLANRPYDEILNTILSGGKYIIDYHTREITLM